jgi:predicted RNA binding protein YcfA (HicA-like mRNA interferase family)
MPRKKRQLKADLRRAGFVVDKNRGKGSHTIWEHSQFPDITVACLDMTAMTPTIKKRSSCG